MFRALGIFVLLLQVGFSPWALALQTSATPNCDLTATPQLCHLLERAGTPVLNQYKKEIQDFYAQDNYHFAWLKENRPTSQAVAMIQAMQNAEKAGLSGEDYHASGWIARLVQFTQSTPAASDELPRFDLDVTAYALRYLSNLCCGRVNPRSLNVHLEVDRKRCKLPEFLRSRIVNAADVAVAVRELEPPYAGYQRTKAALEHYLELAKTGDGEPLPRPRKTIQPGEAYAGLPALQKRLELLGDLPPQAALTPQSSVYEGAVVQAIMHFQGRHGLNPDGKIDTATFKQLTIPLAFRVKQLQLTLERWRWLPRDLPTRLVVVNIPEFVLRAYQDHHAALSMRVIVGKAFREHQTPVFQDEMEYLIFRPYWNVPRRIVRKELVPDVQEKPGFLARNQFQLLNGSGQVVAAEAISPDILQQLRAGQLEVRQKPGAENSLGLIKFVFPNHFDVYMHGTPERQLFSRSRRDFSHGCIRVEDPATLAQWALSGDPSWTKDRIESAMNGSESLRVNLLKALPVLILYGTAIVEETGEVNFFQDIYGQDSKLDRALNRRYPQ
jgi:L,D-transpeptidase YcbB